ncbi:MAG: hypothetical protein WDO56_15765 [Gammaproteobacteria bacterium]
MQIVEPLTLYDVELVRVDEDAGMLYFDTDGIVLGVKSGNVRLWSAGAIGCLSLRPEGAFFFRPYPDPRLRRFTVLDDPSTDVWGWTLGEHRFCVKARVIPGMNGEVVKAHLETVQIDVPQEFTKLCAHFALTPASALRGFIADVCGLQNFIAQPREDGYSSNGSDEREHARRYWSRAYLWRHGG